MIGLPSSSSIFSYLPVIAGGGISGYIARTEGVLCGMLVGTSQAILFMFIMGSMSSLAGPLPVSTALPIIISVVVLGAVSGALGQWLRNR